MDGAQEGDPFNNISASPAQCEERQIRFHRFLSDYMVADTTDFEPTSQASQGSGGHCKRSAARS
jgi:hypothetical protein